MEKLTDTYNKMKEAGYLKGHEKLSEDSVKRQVALMETMVNLCNDHVKTDGLVITLEAIHTLEKVLIHVHGVDALLGLLKEVVKEESEPAKDSAE